MTRTLDTRVDVIRKGVKVAELDPIDSVDIKMNGNSKIKTSLSGTFIPNDEVNWLSDALMPVAIIDGVENHLGLFYPTTVTKSRTDDIVTINIEAYDSCWLVQNRKTEQILSIASSTNYITAVKSLLLQAGITKFVTTPTEATLTSVREDWDIGTDYLTIVNELLSEINYNNLWFDNEGSAVLEPSAMLNISNVERVYNYNNVETLMLSSSTATLDLFSIPNVFLCVCSNPDKNAVMKATAINNNIASPFSVQRRGKRIVSLTKLNNIASQTELQNYADILRNKNMFNGQKITISTAIRTDCGCNDIVALVHPDADGLCTETEWRIDLCTGGTMTHVLAQQPRASIEPAPSGTGAIAGIAIAGISVVGTT